MIISLIVAMDEDRGIGKDNHLPWHIPADLQRFKKLTMGHHLIMGRKTFQSIGKKLIGRQTIVLTRDPQWQTPDGIVAHSLEEALKLAQEAEEQEVFIIGGGEVFQQALPIVDRIYLTIVHNSFNSDTYFPSLNTNEWEEVESHYHPSLDSDGTSYTFKLLVRREANH